MEDLESKAASAPDPALASSPAHNLLSRQPLLFLASYLKFNFHSTPTAQQLESFLIARPQNVGQMTC